MKKELSTDFTARQMMQSGQFEIFYYTDTGPEPIPDHQHTHYELFFFLEGDVTYRAGPLSRQLQWGDLLLIPPGLPHHPSFHSHSSYRRFVLWINHSYFEELCARTPDLSYCLCLAKQNVCCHLQSDDITFQNMLGKLMDLISESRSGAFLSGFQSELLLASLLVEINRLAYRTVQKRPAQTGRDLYLNVCDYIMAHLNEDLSLNRLSSVFYVSKFHIAHTFKQNMGISTHRYIQKKRLAACRNGLLSGVSPGEVAHQYGFSDYTSFFRAFKKEYGISPRVLAKERLTIEPDQ